MEHEARMPISILVPSSVLSLPTSWIRLDYYAQRGNDVSVTIGLARLDGSVQNALQGKIFYVMNDSCDISHFTQIGKQ